MVPENLQTKLEYEARREKISFGELVRRALQTYLLLKKNAGAHDSLLSSKTVFDDEGPRDVSRDHDKYLYGQRVSGKSPS